jgi:hypothetical protein
MNPNTSNGLLADIFDLNRELENDKMMFPSHRKTGPSLRKNFAVLMKNLIAMKNV